MNIYTKQGIEQVEQKLNGIVLHTMTGTSAVEDKDLPAASMEKTEYFNAPTSIEQAIERIMEVEMRLEDLARAAEIAAITGQFNILEGFVTSANESLANKITIDQPSIEDFKVTVVDGSDQDYKDAADAVTKNA